MDSIDKNQKLKKTDDTEITVSMLYTVLLSCKKSIIISSLVGMLIGSTLFLLTPTSYKATALISVVKQEQQSSLSSLGGLGGLAGLAGINLSQGNNIQSTVAIFKSRMFIEGFIEDEGLLTKLFEEDWDNQSNKWISTPPTPRAGFGIYREMMELARESDNIFRVIFIGPNPNTVAELANQSVVRLNNFMREKDIEESKRSIEYLKQQLEETNVKDSQVFLYNLIEDQTKKIMLATARKEYVFSFIDPAIVPTSKYSPIFNQYLFFGFWAGLLFSSFTLILFQTLKNEVPEILKD